jgi:hypothetical protein
MDLTTMTTVVLEVIQMVVQDILVDLTILAEV